MTVANDRACLVQTAPHDAAHDAAPDELHDELIEMVTEYAPRRFALCWLKPEEDDAGIVAWGLVLPTGKVIVTNNKGETRGTFASAEGARRLLGRRQGDLLLMWLDEPAPAALPESENA